MKLIIEDDEGRKTVVPFVREEITIGRQEGNTIRLTERNVSRRHARLFRQNGHVLVEDLGSYNGIRINGERISEQTPVGDGDLIQIGDYDLAIQSEAAAQAQANAPLASVEDVGPAAPAADEPETEADAPVVTPEGRLAEYEEDTAPSPQDLAARRQSTSIIRADHLESSRPVREVVDLDPEEAPRLIVLNSNFQGREFACIRTELRIGRTDDNDIALDHRSLSRTHAKVVREDDGEWRVIDIQSANGLRVNGEPYAQATLRSGDVLELGHVKLKFLGPGETFRFTPGSYDEPESGAPRRSGSKAVLMAIALLVLIGGAIGAGLMLKGRLVKPQVSDRPKPGEREAGGPGTPRQGTETRPPTEAPAVQQANLDQKLRTAREALTAHNYDLAFDILEPIKNPDGTRPREVEQLLAEVQSGQEAQKKAHQEDATAPGKQPSDTRPAVGSKQPDKATATPQEQAQKLLDSGTALIKSKKYKQAIEVFNKCLKLDEHQARCHLKMGVAYARLGEYDQGAKHYQAFLELAPDDPKAPEARQALEEYKQHQR